MKCKWEDLPKKKTVFTIRSAAMKNLNTGKIVQNYSANTRIDVVQKCVTEDNTYYRTWSAAYNNLNWAFEASVFGLPNEAAPSVPPDKTTNKKEIRKPSPQKQKDMPQVVLPAEDGGRRITKLRSRLLSILKHKKS